MSTAFDRFDFADSDGWREVERNIYFSNNNTAEQERILLKRKRKSETETEGEQVELQACG